MSITEDNVLQRIREIAAQILEMSREIRATDELIGDLELDSISLVTLLASVENHYRIKISTEESEALVKVGDLARLVVQRVREGNP